MIGGRGLLVGRDRGLGPGYGIGGGSGVYDIVEKRRKVVFVVLFCIMDGVGNGTNRFSRPFTLMNKS